MELISLSALEQAALISKKQLSSEELVRALLDRSEKLNPKLQAFVEIYRKDALCWAREKDRQTLTGAPLPAFHGVPIGIKDLNLVRGKRTRMGSRGFLPFWAPCDDASVSPLRRAGFVILGKLATSELGALPITEPDIHPPTRNPWNADHTPGGSSGGSATAVAAGLLPVAHASDGGGSIRIPASFTGLVGLKPARGRLRNQFRLPDRQIMYTTGALTRTVADSAALLDIMAGITEGKPHWATPPAEPFAVLAAKKPPRLRVRLTFDSPFVKADPEVREAIMATARLLESLGHKVEETALPEHTDIEDFLPLWKRLIADFPLMRWSLAQPITRWLREGGVMLKTKEVHARHLELEKLFLDWFSGTDLWLTPTVPVLPPRVGQYSQQGEIEPTFKKIAEIAAFTAFCNVTGQPAISLPAGHSRSGLPIGAHLVGPVQGEALLLQVAREIEEHRPWPRIAPL